MKTIRIIGFVIQLIMGAFLFFYGIHTKDVISVVVGCWMITMLELFLINLKIQKLAKD